MAGEPSVRSRFGIESPTLTKAGRVEWKVLATEMEDERAAKLRGRREDRNAILEVVAFDVLKRVVVGDLFCVVESSLDFPSLVMPQTTEMTSQQDPWQILRCVS